MGFTLSRFHHGLELVSINARSPLGDFPPDNDWIVELSKIRARPFRTTKGGKYTGKSNGKLLIKFRERKPI
jgi:hypothetical protein